MPQTESISYSGTPFDKRPPGLESLIDNVKINIQTDERPQLWKVHILGWPHKRGSIVHESFA